MKSYLRKNLEKSSSEEVDSYSNLVSSFLSRTNPRQRIIQPSTKEQQRILLLNANPNRLQHVHDGKYGIKPIWPTDKSSTEKHVKSSIKESWLPEFLQNEKFSLFNLKSDFKKTKFNLWIEKTDRSTLILLSVSLVSVFFLLLLLFYAKNRHQEKLERENKKTKIKQNRNVREKEFREQRTIQEDRTTIRTLPTITEEISSIVSTPTEQNKNIFVEPPKIETKSNEKNLEKQEEILPTKIEQNLTTVRKRRSRFDETTENKQTNLNVAPNDEKSIEFRHHVIADEFTSLDQINKAVEDVGLVRSQLIFGIDYTISNLETGKNSFNGLSLHHIQDDLLNPYQSVITIIGRTLEKFDSDNLIPAFGFGDRATLDRKIFPLRPDGNYCKGFVGVLEAYNEITPKIRMSGPTNFAPLIREAIRIVKKTRQYHIVVIVADGQVTNERQTKDAIVEASNYPLSIVMIGVGDGPWNMMKEFDDSLPTRQFDNFQFVEYNKIVQAANDQDSTFALHALMEIPSQYATIKQLGLLKDK